MKDRAFETPLEDLRTSDLIHYDEVASKAYHYRNAVTKAINFFYDYKQMSLIQKIKLAFK